jgi:catechol-2,3-dioxygenase
MAAEPRLSLAVVYVSDLDVAVSFYTDVLRLSTSNREPTAALLATEGRSPLILRSMGENSMRSPGSIGVQYVVWAASDEQDLDHAERTLKARSAHVETRHGEGYTIVEGRDPDGCPVLVAYPAPDQLPLHSLPARIYAW